MSGQDGQTATFDLSDISTTLYRKWLRSKWLTNLVGLVGMALFGAIWLAYAVLDAIPSGLSRRSESELGLAAFFFATSYVFYFTANARVRQPATAVELRPEALVVAYGPRRRKVLPWEDPAFRLRIDMMQSSTLGTEVPNVLFWSHPRLFLTHEASEAIVAAAKRHGLSVETVQDPDSTTGNGVLIRRAPAPG